jgi:nitroimidazol reductase NimA-like FMN-containing flavoprotein (pyridoxamine 5'-phosphate oxidase superfamily)
MKGGTVRGRLTDLPELHRVLSDVLATQNFGVLCTQGNGGPYGTVVCFATSFDLSRIWFSTTRSTRKFTHIRDDDRVAFVVDNASNRPADLFEAVAITGTGHARELTGAEREAASEQYLAKHPHLKEFTGTPNCALVEVEVETFHVVTRFQEVVEIQVD